MITMVALRKKLLLSCCLNLNQACTTYNLFSFLLYILLFMIFVFLDFRFTVSSDPSSFLLLLLFFHLGFSL